MSYTNQYYEGDPVRTDADLSRYTLKRNYKTGSYENQRKRYCRKCKNAEITDLPDYCDNCASCDRNIELERNRPKVFWRRMHEHMMDVHPLIYCLSLGTYTCSENCYCKIYHIYY